MSNDTKTLRLRGVKDSGKSRLLTEHGVVSTSRGRVRLGVARDLGGIEELRNVNRFDVACVEYSNGFRRWIRVDDLHDEFGVCTARGRSAGSTRAGETVWEIDPRFVSASSERGAAGVIVEALEVFGVDLKGRTAKALSGWFEKRQLQDKTPGLYQISLEDAFTKKVVAKLPATTAGKPALLFIHGTASSIQGSIGRLWDTDNRAGRAVRQALKQVYGERVYAFEHLSLTQSPIDNALDLVEKYLPQNAVLDLVTHSRGGLIGDLLCLAQRDDGRGDPLKPALLDKVFAKDRTLGEMLGLGKRDATTEYQHERQQFDALLKALGRKQLQINRYVRVACPARGTTLASGRLDRWLSVLQYAAPDALGDVLDFLLAVVHERTDPRTLPGLEAMMPGSALVRLLNHPDLLSKSDLSVIAGDLDGDSLWSKLKVAMTDWFYAGDHDLVVNTGSMYGGVKRSENAARFFRDEGRDVNHFNYFINERTVKLVQAGLLRADGADAGFRPVSEAKQEVPASRAAMARSGTQGPRPVVIVLPGTMGSELLARGDRVWLDLLDLARGGLEDLAFEATNITVGGPLEDFYGAFLVYLSRTNEVVPFAYDWRLSLTRLADDLAAILEGKLAQCERQRQPLRIAAHSMGGLVVRTLIGMAKHKPLWERMRKLPGSRLVMFGTPNAGSYEAVRWITGRNPTLGKLALLDLTHDRDEILQIVTRYPGMLELLPSRAGVREFSQPGLWSQLQTQMKESWPEPQPDALKALSGVWKVVHDSPIDPAFMIYVAGCARRTVCDYEVVPGVPRPLLGDLPPDIRFYSTREGDGTVTWQSGRLPGVETWYVQDTLHDELLSNESAFPAYLDLLNTGRTTRLANTPPAASRSVSDAEAMEIMPADLPESLPAATAGTTLGLGRARPKPAQRSRVPCVRLSVRHGDLAYARHPVCVGHYQGDTIVSAEAALDRKLKGALSDRVRLDLYPGPRGTHHVFISRDRYVKPGGAIVIGLGPFGELSPGMLEDGVTHALIEYALQVADWPDDRCGAKNSARSAAVSMLLIGTGAGSMALRDSIASILWGVRAANERLVETGFDSRVLIDDLEFIELYHDLAIQAVDTLSAVLKDGELANHFDWPDAERVVQDGQGGRRRVTFEEAPDWWRRLAITHDQEKNVLRYTAYGELARAEETLVTGQIRLVENFIETVRGSTGNSREISRTLFEMLLPINLKELAPNQYNLVLLVEEKSAALPWELLENRWGINDRPLAVAAGMLRQFRTANFRQRPAYPFARTAYVVGDPLLPPPGPDGPVYAQLPGAAKEAEEVGQLLTQSGYATTLKVGDTAENILTGLHGEAYQILHLAAHGVHQLDVPGSREPISGMVIGKEVFLTPGDVEQMRWVPELVFINCCHLGRIESSDRRWKDYNGLAANLGQKFIEMGVKAVVAAGWAVDDSAARHFARSFYGRMLDGEGFGEAVRAAREEIHGQFPQVNTWGAYQCYGDPDFRLVHQRTSGPSSEWRYASAHELIADLENLTSDARVRSSSDATDWGARINDKLSRIPVALKDRWLERADVSVALGLLHGELAEYAKAVKLLDDALQQNKAEFPVRAVEQLANFRVRHVLQQWCADRGIPGRRSATGARSAKLNDLIKQIESAIEDLSRLLEFGATPERHSLLGSAWKRRAWLDARRRPNALREMAEHYRKAHELAGTAWPEQIGHYPFSNWLIAEAVLAWHRKATTRNWRKQLYILCARAMEQAKQKELQDPDFWNSVVEPDCRLLQAIADGKLEDAEQGDIADAYKSAVARGASRRGLDSVIEHLDFLIAMSSDARVRKSGLRKQLQSLRARLA